MNASKEIFKCALGEETWMAINFLKEDKNDIYLLSFEFTYPVLTLSERIRRAWNLLTGVGDVMQSVSLTRDDATKLRAFLKKTA